MRLPNLKLSTTTISLRMPTGVLDQIKVTANKRDMPYQSLIKGWLAEKVERLTSPATFRPAKPAAKSVAKPAFASAKAAKPAVKTAAKAAGKPASAKATGRKTRG